MIDDEFDVLVSTSDFMKLQSKCQQLELDKSQLSSTVLQLAHSNSEMMQKIANLEGNIRYLSEKGIKMAQNLLQKNKQADQLKNSFADNDRLEKSKYSQIQKQHFSIKQQLKTFHTVNKQKQDQYADKIKQLSARCQSMQNQSRKQKQQIKSLTILNENMFKEKQKALQRNKQLAISHQVYKKQIEASKIKINQLQAKVANLQQSIASITNQYNQLNQERQKKEFQLSQWKQYSKIKLQKLQKLQKQYLDAQKGQGVQIRQLQVRLKEKQKMLQFYEQFYEKNYSLVMKAREDEEKQSVKRQKNHQLQLKKVIENYFFQIAVNLKEMNLSGQQIDKYLKEQEETIKKYMQEVVYSVLQTREKKKGLSNYMPFRV